MPYLCILLLHSLSGISWLMFPSYRMACGLELYSWSGCPLLYTYSFLLSIRCCCDLSHSVTIHLGPLCCPALLMLRGPEVYSRSSCLELFTSYFCNGPACRLHDSLSRNLFWDHSIIKGNPTLTAWIYFSESQLFPYKKNQQIIRKTLRMWLVIFHFLVYYNIPNTNRALSQQ